MFYVVSRVMTSTRFTQNYKMNCKRQCLRFNNLLVINDLKGGRLYAYHFV